MASVDRGKTAYVGPTQPRITTAGDLSTPDQSWGLYSVYSSGSFSDGRGNTSYMGPRGNRTPSAGDMGTPSQDRGTYGDSSNAASLQDRDRGITTYIRSEMTQLPVSGTTVYKMTGWYALGSTYESWVSSFPNTAPPSGHVLTFVNYVVLAGGNAN